VRRIIWQLALQGRRDRERSIRDPAEGVAIGSRFRDSISANHTTGTWNVLDCDRDAQWLSEFLRDNSRGNIGGAAGRECNNDADLPFTGSRTRGWRR
jgi:hypothetical protein